MTNTLEFELALKRSGLTKRKVAEMLEISEMSLYKKIHNESEFKASELAKLYTLFHLEDDVGEQRKIFFCQ